MKWHRILALMLKYWYITIARADRLFDVFYWPMIDLVVWGFASKFITELSEVNLLSVLLGAVILWTFLWRASQDMSVYVLEDFWSRNLYHLFSSPIKVSEHIIAIILFGLGRSLVTFVFLAILAFALYAFNIFSIPLFFLIIAIFLLSLLGWILGLVITGLIFRFGQRIQVLAWSVVWILQPFSCVFYPLSALPPWAAAIARVTPSTYVFENLRNILAQRPLDYGGLGYALIVEVIFLLLASWYLKKSFDAAKKSGLLATGN
ncbi:ABC transporter permease [Candidatus Woesearchaeota archaeon]|nr:ABC transporter permease [Candidatus Woesearchaeota archaeon]